MKKIFFLPVLLSLFVGVSSCTKDDDTAEELAANAAAATNTYTITILYEGSTATVTIPSNLSETVTCPSGTSPNVRIVNTNVADELTYDVSGACSEGSLSIESDYKMVLQLNGLELTAPIDSAAINIKCGKRIAVVLGEETTNTLADVAGGKQSACFRTKGHLEFSGGGTLNVTGNTKHAISTKEYTKILKSTGTINILGAASDAFHVGQFFQMNGGTVNIDANTLGDGIQVDYKMDGNDVPIPLADDEENTASAIIYGGTLNITMGGSEDTKGIKTEGNVYIYGGEFNINVNSNGSRGIQTDVDMLIGSHTDETTGETTEPSINIVAAGTLCTEAADAGDPHRCMCIKVGRNLAVNAGTITLSKPGAKARGLRVSGTIVKNGGTAIIDGISLPDGFTDTDYKN